jgi:glutamyl-tRNA synthetase
MGSSSHGGNNHSEIRLIRGLCWYRPTPQGAFAGKSLGEARKAKAPIIQWLPPAHTIPCILHKPDGDMKGYCEPMVTLDAGKVVQFERIGFVRIEKATAQIIEAYWGHR